MLRSVAKSHLRLLAALERARRWASDRPVFEATAERVSAWSVGRHLEHLLLSDRRIVGLLEPVADGEGRPSAFESTGRPSLAGQLVLLTGFIPRGRGEAPEFTVPMGLASDRVEEGFGALGHRVERLGAGLEAVARATGGFRHPALGTLTPSQWLRFAAVHHAHHEKVICDILRAVGAPGTG